MSAFSHPGASASGSQLVEPHVVRLTMSWHYATVGVSYLVAVLASYSMVNVMQHPLSHAVSILAALGFAVGGVWSMHFLGMEAMLLGVDVEFEPGLTVGTAVITFACSAVALVLCKWQVSQPQPTSQLTSNSSSKDSADESDANSAERQRKSTSEFPAESSALPRPSSQLQLQRDRTHSHTAHEKEARQRQPNPGSGSDEQILTNALDALLHLLSEQWRAFRNAPHLTLNLAAWLIALGACTMHYVGLEAMKTVATVEFNVPVVAASVLVAIFASTAGLYMALVFPVTKAHTVPTALVMGVALCGVHYSGMYGLEYSVDLNSPAYLAAKRPKSVDRPWGFWILAFSLSYSFCLLSLNSYLYQRSLSLALMKSRSALRASKTVAALLAAYDTNAVALALDEYEHSLTADSAMVTAYRSLLTNLNTYRPFLPQYLFLTSEEDDARGSDGRRSEGTTPLSSGSDRGEGRRRSGASERSAGSKESARQHSAHRESPHDHQGRLSPGALGPLLCPTTRFLPALQCFAGVVSYCRLSFVLTENQRVSTAPAGRAHRASPADVAASARMPGQIDENCAGEHNSQRRLHDRPLGLQVWEERLVSAQQAAVLAVNRIARTTSTSVHSVTGDAVLCSWNATRRVQQPAAKMATFILRLQSALSDSFPSAAVVPCQPTFDSTLSLCGVGFTGQATCLLAGDATGRMPMVSGYWAKPAAPGAPTVEVMMAEEARLLGTVVIDSATATGSETVAETLVVDAIGALSSRRSLEPERASLLPQQALPLRATKSAADKTQPTAESSSSTISPPRVLDVEAQGNTDAVALLPIIDTEEDRAPHDDAPNASMTPTELPEGIGVDAVPPTIHLVHVLATAFEQEADDEWMYVMQQQETRRKKAANCPLSAAVAAALRGDFESAVECVRVLRHELAYSKNTNDVGAAASGSEEDGRAPPSFAEESGSNNAIRRRAAAVVEAKLQTCISASLGPREFACIHVVDAVRFVTTIK